MLSLTVVKATARVFPEARGRITAVSGATLSVMRHHDLVEVNGIC